MLWTVFKILFVVWMLQLVLQFGASVLPLVLVVSMVALLLRLISTRTSFNRDRLHCRAYNQLSGHVLETITLKNKARVEDRKVRFGHS